jgi:hypothetical protein
VYLMSTTNNITDNFSLPNPYAGRMADISNYGATAATSHQHASSFIKCMHTATVLSDLQTSTLSQGVCHCTRTHNLA